MATLNELISDIELRLTSGNISDDFNIDKRQIEHWITIVRAQLIKQKFTAEGSQGIESYISFFPCLSIKEENTDCQCKEPFRFVVELPGTVLALPGDLGIYQVELQSGETIKRTRITDQQRMKSLRYGIGKTLTFYREKKKLIINGGNFNLMKNGKVNLFLVIEKVIDANEEYPIDASSLPILLEMVEQIGRRELQLPEDINNDGVQDGVNME